MESDFAPSTKLVAGAIRVCKCKTDNQVIRVSSDTVISYIKRKKEFTRKSMETTMGFNEGQTRWHIKNLIKKEIIKKTKKTIFKQGKGQNEVVFRYIQ